MYRLIYKFVEPNQDLGKKVRVLFGFVTLMGSIRFGDSQNVGSSSVRSVRFPSLKQTSAILEFYFRFQSRPLHRNGRVILHQTAEIRPNRISDCGNMTSYRFSRWRPLAGFRNPGRYPIFWVNPAKTPAKAHPKFNPVSFLMLRITKDFIMFKAFNSTTSEFAK